MRTRFFPAWDLPNGTKNASEPELEVASSSCETWGIWCGVFVVLSVAVELIIAWCDPPYETFLKLSIWPDAVIGIGIVGEVLFGMLDSRIQTALRKLSNDELGEAKKEAGEANERAENAQKETEQLRAVTAWRRLSQNEHEALALALRGSGSDESVRFCVVMNDQESLNFAQYVSIPFKAAGWEVGFRFSSYTHGIMTGILLPTPSDNWLEGMKSVNGRVRSAFIAAGIEFVNGWPLDPYIWTDDHAPLREPTALIYIGPKPMPPFT